MALSKLNLLENYHKLRLKLPERKVIHIPTNRHFRALIVGNTVDVVPLSIHYRPSGYPQDLFVLEPNAVGPYDPVIDLNNFLVTYGTNTELEAFKKYLPQLLWKIKEYPVHLTFSIYSKTTLSHLAKYSSIWGALTKVKLVIDAENILRKSIPEGIMTVNDWLSMSREEQLKLLARVLGDETRAKATLEYLISPAYTGVHFVNQPGEAPYGVILVLDIKLLYPITAEALQKVYKKPYDKRTMIGWVRKPRFLNAADVLGLIMEAPIVLGRTPIDWLYKT